MLIRTVLNQLQVLSVLFKEQALFQDDLTRVTISLRKLSSLMEQPGKNNKGNDYLKVSNIIFTAHVFMSPRKQGSLDQ